MLYIQLLVVCTPIVADFVAFMPQSWLLVVYTPIVADLCCIYAIYIRLLAVRKTITTLVSQAIFLKTY